MLRINQTWVQTVAIVLPSEPSFQPFPLFLNYNFHISPGLEQEEEEVRNILSHLVQSYGLVGSKWDDS